MNAIQEVNSMENSLSRLRELWQNTSQTNRIMVIALLAVMLVTGIGFAFFAGTPDYATLVSNPAPADSAKILDMLKTQKVPYRISSDGASIEVPRSQEAELRMDLAGQGLLNSGAPGYELLDKAPFGETQAMEQDRIRRALEGEMENAIQSLDPVASASVKFAAGDDSPLVNPDKKDPSASVLVHLKPGCELSKANVRAIVSLVKSAYTGLDEKNITLVDGEGNLLWDGSEMADGYGGIDDRMSEEKAYTDMISRQIQSQIRAMVGPYKSSVLVRANLNLDRQVQTVHTVQPGVRTSRTTDEESLKGGGSIGGSRTPPGVASNAGGAVSPPVYAGGSNVQTGSGNYTHTTSTETDEVSTTDTKTVMAPGEAKTLDVSIVLDDTVPPATAQAVHDMVQNYIGQDMTNPANRQVVVKTVTFDKTARNAEKAAQASAANSEMIRTVINYLAPTLLILMMLFLLARGLKKGNTGSAMNLAVAGGQRNALSIAGSNGVDVMVGSGGGEMVPVGEDDENGSRVIGLKAGEDVHTFEVISEAFDANLESIVHLSRSKPEMVARLVKSLMSEEK
jgi:flagellar M-ring protein FliF